MKTKISCNKCKGTGKYSYHYTESSNGFVDEWIEEDCDQCGATGKVELKKFKVEGVYEVPTRARHVLAQTKDEVRKLYKDIGPDREGRVFRVTNVTLV